MKSIPMLLVTLTVATAIAPTWADDASDAQRFMKDAYKRSDRASSRKDSRMLLSFLAPDYKGVFGGKTVTKAGMSRNMKFLFPMAKTLNVKTTIKSISYAGKKVTVLAHEHASLQGVYPRTRKPISLVMDSNFQDVWIKSGSSWLKQSTQTLGVKSILNGKPVKPGLQGKTTWVRFSL